jgi:phage terminase Nu1 subunit (DNA packaging protein)
MPEVVTKAAFADELGLSKARITQLVAKGLPVTSSGRIPRKAALAWYEEHVAPHRRKALRATPFHATARGELDQLRVERERLALARDRAELVERAAVERAAFARARADRDALIGWASRVSAQLAAELGADPAAAFVALDRLVREHLAERADTPLIADDD